MTGAARDKGISSRSALAERVLDRGFTPAIGDVDAILDLLADDDVATAAERAVARVRAAAIPVLCVRLEMARPPLRGRIVRIIGRIAAQGVEPRAVDALVRALDDRDPKARRNAAIALGHLRDPGVESALLCAWSGDPSPEMRRSLASSLGKTGTPRALTLLRDASHADDAELARIAQRAVMMIERTASRPPTGQAPWIDASRAPPHPIAAIALCRSGLEEILAAELGGISAVDEIRVDGGGRVLARLHGPMRALFEARTMLSFRFPLPRQNLDAAAAVQSALARAVTSDTARVVFETWDAGAPRYRIAWEDGGHRRAATWEAARVIARAAPMLVNDSTAATWQIAVAAYGSFLNVSIVPRRLRDPRFGWRVAAVPAASHPTIAAALARVAGVRHDDVVWDPFVGSGAELVERALLGPFRSLLGSDTDPSAIAAARRNLTAAGLPASLENADARTLRPRGVTLVLTNPPMGRRVARASGLAGLLDDFLAHAASVLRPGGRLVWIAPWQKRARATAVRLGLELRWARNVDMGGFEGEMQRWDRPE